MQSHFANSSSKITLLVIGVFLLGAGLAVAQQQVNLTAQSSTLTLPDGNIVPMWGYICGTAVSSSSATCANLNPSASGWSPVVITVPTTATGGLSINLTNNLTFSNGNSVPTSIVIVGQLGGGLGTVGATCTGGATCTPAPAHPALAPSWPIANNSSTFTPPPQGPRVQSFSTEVSAGATALLPTWANLKPGTYLLESGTHPSIQGPMGLYGILVVTTAPSSTVAGTAYPGVSYNAEVPLLFSEIDPVQNKAVSTAVNTAGFTETAVWSGQPGGCGNPSSSTYNTCYPPAVNYKPLYYLINGVGFNKANAPASLFPASPATGVAGLILVRLVNAGVRMHVPSIVGSQTGSPAVAGFSLIAEDGNPLPGVPRVQSEVFMAAGKTYDVMVNVPPTGSSALAVFDRELSLSGNATARDAGMLAYVGINGSAVPSAPAFVAAVANPDTYNAVISGQTLTVSDPAKGVIANDVNVYGVKVLTAPTKGTLTLNPNGTFVYVPNTGWTAPDSFVYQANGAGPTATVTLNGASIEAANGITLRDDLYVSNVATSISIKSPGVLANDTDAAGYRLTAIPPTTPLAGLNLTLNADGSFTANPTGAGNATCPVGAPAGANCFSFTYTAQNSQGTSSASSATATLVFLKASNLHVTVIDGQDKTTPITDYRWIIEEDRTFYVDPNCTTNPPPTGCPTAASGIVPTFGTNFHTSYMPVVATGCTGTLSCESGQTLLGQPAVCDIGNGVCRTTASEQTPVDPGQVSLDPTKRYYISVLPGDAANPFNAGYTGGGCQYGAASATSGSTCGHGMGGAPIAASASAVTVLTQPSPYPPARLSVFVFEDDFPLNGEQDAGGGIDVLATNEPGLGGFNIELFDDAGGTGDATGQMTYDMFNMPLSNSLAGTVDPATGLDACPISLNSTLGGSGVTSPTGITGQIVTCPRFEADGRTLSPLAGQAVVANLMPGRFSIVATPAADRIGRGEEWLQTNTLDGQKAHDSFLRIGEPSYFQEFGPAGYHVSIGFANPVIINSRLPKICTATGDGNLQASDCTHAVMGSVSTERMSRTPDERLYGSGSYDSFSFTQCYVSLGDTDGEDFAFTKCDSEGNFKFTGIPSGNWRVTVFDQWNDMLVDGLSTPVAVGTGSSTTNIGQIAMNQWQANIYTTTFFDQNGNGVRDNNEPGLTLVPTNIRFRDGSFSNFNNTDLNGYASFNEEFPLFSWYVVESDTTRYKNTGTHVVYDAGGPADGTPCGSAVVPPSAPCGSSTIAQNLANTVEIVSVPTNLRVPGAVYCATADCAGKSVASGPGSSDPPSACSADASGNVTCSTTLSTGRIDPSWVTTEGWQGFSGQNNFLEFGKTPFAVGENGGIHGHVIYASTRPFDDPTLLLQTSWEPLVPGVTINLYQEGFAQDGVTQTLKLVDTTLTSSWDLWAQGFRSDGVPNMNCPGQGASIGADADLFFFTLYNQPMWLDFYSSQHGGPVPTALPNNSQFKCYDGMHNWNQLQPAPYDGMYSFPSIAGRNPSTGVPVGGTGSVAGTNCTICVANPADGTPMLPVGKYVVEVIVPPGYELVKEEDKNILIGDNFIAPVTQEFGGLSNIFILPDQAEVGTAYNANNAQNPTQTLGRFTFPSSEGDTGEVETYWPCVGATRVVPDYISLFPQSKEVSPFAGATRNLCDRKEVALTDQMSVLAKFYIFTSTHATAHFTGVITDDFTSEFDPFAPQFGEKFSPPNLPISIKDWSGAEVSRVYADQWGTYDGITYSTWEVNPPNPTGYSPTMMVTCMNDPGKGTTPDPLFNPEYSQFCYEIPFMPGQTQYMDTPVVPTSAFAGAGYNNPDCSYPNATPAISEVDGDGIGPWVLAPFSNSSPHRLTITALGDQAIPNNGYSGPSATGAPFNQKTITRHYGFGNTQGTVTIGGVSAPVDSWTDGQVVVRVPSGVPLCGIQQESQYGGPGTSPTTAVPAEHCGELLITAANGQQSIDSVTVTIGGKQPKHVMPMPSATTNSPFGPLQAAIDAAAPGDLIIVNPGVYNEILLMWKPVRLQGVGAASSVINANSQPAGRMTPWRAAVSCLFGLALNGQPYSTPGNLVPLPGGGGNEPLNIYDPSGQFSCPATGWNYFNGGPNNPQVDRIPLEGILGWDTSLNGNLAELLQEPTLMGAYEGAGITVLAKGVRYPAGLEVFGAGQDNASGSNIAHEGQMPASVAADGSIHGTLMLTGSAADCNTTASGATGYSSNFMCNPSRIDGLSVTDSSQGGGGIYVHGWGHLLEVSNNRVYNNTGTLTGGITVGQGESPDALLSGNGGDPVGFDQQPWTCNDLVPGAEILTAGPNATNQNVSPAGFPANQQLPYCYNEKVNLHNNYITRNSSIGDELFSSTPAGGGGVTFCTGSDYYKFNYNWVCGNLSTGDGGGMVHLGFSYNGDLEHNTFLFNQSTNPTVPTNGGGLIIMGAAPDGQLPGAPAGAECGSVTDVDCAPGLSDGTGPNLTINANLIMGNSADSGSGGGLRFQDVDGTNIGFFPNGRTSGQWHHITVTNNIIANNVAGWDGAGLSLQDALDVDLINNTIISNDTTASSGVLADTIGAPLSSAPSQNCIQPGSTTSSCPQAAGLVTMQNTALLTSSLTGLPVVCPNGHGTNTTTSTQNCTKFSIPLIANDVIWQNRAFYIGVGGLGSGGVNQQNVVSLYNAFSTTQAVTQPTTDAISANGNGTIITGGTGACVAPVSYWDIGARNDTGPTNHASGVTLAPTYSVLTPGINGDYGASTLHNTNDNPTFVSQYCNGSRTPPEFKSLGYQVPPGISDATVPNPIFNLTPSATVDEGNNWINISWGPLSETNPVTNAVLGNYAPTLGSSVINLIPNTATANYNEAPNLDFFGNARKTNNAVDAGAVEFQSSTLPALSSIAPNEGARGTSVSVTLTGTNLTGTTSINVSGGGFTVSNLTVVSSTSVTATFIISPTAGLTSRNVSVTTAAGASNTVTFTVINPPAPTLTSVVPNSGARGTAVPVTLTGTNFTAGTTVGVSGAGVGVSGITVNSSTQLTAVFTITTGAAATSRSVTVTTPGGTSNSQPFMVTGPTLTSISPTSGARGTTVTVTLTGTGLTGATGVDVSGSGVTVSNVTAVNDTTVTATFTITAGANLTARNVSVVTSTGPTNNVAFTIVNPPPPTLASISPASGSRGASVAVTLTGTNFTTGTTVAISGAGVSHNAVTVVNATTITTTFTITAGAAQTGRNVTVTTPGGTSSSVTFTVN